MEVTVIVHGHLREFLATEEEEIVLTLESPRTIESIIEQELGLKPQLFMKAFVDGEPHELEAVVSEDCQILLISPTAGG